MLLFVIYFYSTHPNPWRPPTIFEATLPGRSDFMNLEQWTQPTFVKTQMGFENTELTEKLRYYGTRGILLGKCLSFLVEIF